MREVLLTRVQEIIDEVSIDYLNNRHGKWQSFHNNGLKFWIEGFFDKKTDKEVAKMFELIIMNHYRAWA